MKTSPLYSFFINNFFIIFVFSASAVLLVSIISMLFFQITDLSEKIQQISLNHIEILQSLRLENSIQAEKILILENLINYPKPIEVASQYSSNFAIFKLILACLSVIALITGGYYCFNMIFQKTIISKILGGINYFVCTTFDYTFCGGSTYVKTVLIPFHEYNFELKIDMRGDETCAITYRFLSDNVFLPFERFLELHQDLVKDLDITSINTAFASGSSQKVAEVLASNSEEIACGLDAFKLVFVQ